MAKAPPYIQVELLRAMSLTHEWDNDDPYSVLPDTDDELIASLKPLSARAKKAFTVACAEWLGWRFPEARNSSLLLDYCEASWAGLYDWDLQLMWEPPESPEFQGPVGGPIGLAALSITNCHNSLGMGGGAAEGAFMVAQVEHVFAQRRTVYVVAKSCRQSTRETLPLEQNGS